MRALLDVNMLIALLDAGHVHHEAANTWFGANIEQGWASCPLTQNGCLRIMSADVYPRHQPLAAVAQRLREATNMHHHTFWPDEISVLDESRFDQDRWLGSRQITDAYLLALAVNRGGVFVTLDRGVDRTLVKDAEPHHLVTI
ncbi:MAG: TA system VapC family ribonuclease toxin [Steroidobacteraceae bacterium]